MTKNILLVEDNGTDEKLTLRAFKKAGLNAEIFVVRDGAEALDYLFGAQKFGPTPPPLPALVLLDLKLPRISGLDVLRELRAQLRTKLLPVIIFTSSVEEEDILRGYTLGANAYVRKPVEFSQFAEAARTLGVFWLSLNEAAPLQMGK